MFRNPLLHSSNFIQLHPPLRNIQLWKYLMYFIAGINTKYFLNIPKEKYFAPLRILNSSIKSFVNPFVDIALSFLIIHLIHFYLK